MQKTRQQRGQTGSVPRRNALRGGGNQRIVTQSANGDSRNGSRKPFVPKRSKLKIIPLGGMGKICKNMMVYEYDDPNLPNGGDIFIIDMGLDFPDMDMYGIDYVIPDTTYLENKKDKIRGIIITHGHEDHIGAIPHLWPKFNVPIYATRFTAGLIERKLSEYKLLKDKRISIIDPDESLRLGVFRIEFFRVTHSIPESIGLMVYSPYGLIVHTSDFKLDPTPILGGPTELEKLKAVCDRSGGALLLLSNSTNAEEHGSTMSEKNLEESFVEVFNQARGRIIIASFASQINRIQQIIWAAEKHGRKVAIAGRSMQNYIEVATRLGNLKIPDGLLVNLRDINKYPDDMVTVLCTGSQGQQFSALVRMSTGDHAQIDIKKTDTIVLSASPIPGNEEPIVRMMDDLMRQGPRVIYNKNMKIHVTGHAFQDELVKMIQITRPKYFVPIHGDYHHLVVHRELAVNAGIPERNTFVIEDGNILEIDENDIKVSSHRVPVGIVMVDGLGVGDIGNIVLRDRQAMAHDGIFVVIVTIDGKKMELASSPDIISRGFVYMRDSEKLIHGARATIKDIFSEHKGRNPFDPQSLKEDLKQEIGDYLYRSTKRRPMVVPVLIEV